MLKEKYFPVQKLAGNGRKKHGPQRWGVGLTEAHAKLSDLFSGDENRLWPNGKLQGLS